MLNSPVPTPPNLSRTSSSSSSSSSSTYYDSESPSSFEKLPFSFPPSSLSLSYSLAHSHPQPTPQPTPQEPYTKAPELYFPDGNLILRADRVLFRVYAGLLAARSSVFRDMLAFPRPMGGAGGERSGEGKGGEGKGEGGDGDVWLDGCPVVQVYDDPKELAVFLRAVFDSSYFAPPPTRTTLPTLTGILRLSLKYDIPYLTHRCLLHLDTTFPTTLAGWKARDARRTIPPVDNTPFAVLRVAREFDLVWVVPSVVYCISSHPFGKTVDGAVWRGGGDFDLGGGGERERGGASTALWDEEDEDGEESSQSTSKSDKPKPDHIELPWADKKMCIRARQRILMAQSEFALSLLEQPPLEECECVREQARLEAQAQAQAASEAAGAAAPAVPAVNVNDTSVVINFHHNNAAAPAAALVPAAAPPPAAAPAQPTAQPPAQPQPTTDPAPEPTRCTRNLHHLSRLIQHWDMAGLLDYFEADDAAYFAELTSLSFSHSSHSSHSSSTGPGQGQGQTQNHGQGQGQGQTQSTSHALSGLCPACRRSFLARWREGCRTMWADLAWVCGFGSTGGVGGSGGAGGEEGQGGNGGGGTGNGWEMLERERMRAMMMVV